VAFYAELGLFPQRKTFVAFSLAPEPWKPRVLAVFHTPEKVTERAIEVLNCSARPTRGNLGIPTKNGTNVHHDVCGRGCL